MTVTVLSGPERRRRWTAAEKLRLVEETLAPGARVAEVARRHDVHPNLLHAWRGQARTGALARAIEGKAKSGVNRRRIGTPRIASSENVTRRAL